MAASQAKLREMFGAMSIEQKGQFIENLKKTLEGSTDFEDMQFLDECMMIYMMELEAAESGEAASDGAFADAESETPVATEAVVHVVSDDDFDISEDESEPLVEAEPETEETPEPDAEVESEAEIEPEPEFVVEPEVEVEPESVAEPEDEIEPEPVSEPEVEVTGAAELVDDSESEAVVEDEPSTSDDFAVYDEPVASAEFSFDDEPVVIEDEPIADDFSETAASNDIVSAEISKPKIVNIEVRIAELYDNIGKNLSVIETISNLLSGTDSEVVDAIKQTQITEPTELLDCAGDYASKIEYIESRFAELADSIRHDMSIIEGISSLLK